MYVVAHQNSSVFSAPAFFLIVGSCPRVDPIPHSFNSFLTTPTTTTLTTIVKCNVFWFSIVKCNVFRQLIVSKNIVKKSSCQKSTGKIYMIFFDFVSKTNSKCSKKTGKFYMIFFDFVSKKRIVTFNAFFISIDEINLYQMH